MDTFLKTLTDLIFFLLSFCGFYLYSSSWSCIWDVYECVYMKRLYEGKTKQYINYGSSGESLQCFQVVIFFSKLSWLWTSLCSPALMFVFLVWAVYAKVDIFREILNTFMQVNIALLMLFAYLMLNNAIVNKEFCYCII